MQSNQDSLQDGADIERAKQVVIEIIRCAGGSVDSKTKLFKMFYFAHLIYEQNNVGCLSDWPIVKMPLGPGIDESKRIFSALKNDGLLEERKRSVGPYLAYEYRSIGNVIPPLPSAAIDAIREAVQFAADKSAAELSEITHEFSNSWKFSNDGDRLNISIDLLTEDTYLEMRERVREDINDLRLVVG